MQNPSQLRRRQCDFPSGGLDGVGVAVGDGSRQISPNQADEVQEWLVVALGAVEVGIAGGEVMVCDCVVVVPSLQPQNKPLVWQSVDVGVDDTGDVEMGSLQPNQPGVLHGVEEVLVAVGTLLLVVLVVVVVSSLQPNQPGVLQVDVDVEVVVVVVLVVVAPEVVVSSRHPYHPGV